MDLPMNLSMSKKARNLTLLGLATGLVLTPLVMMGIRRWRNRSRQNDQQEGAPPNHIFSAYRGRFRPHRRKHEHNGVH